MERSQEGVWWMVNGDWFQEVLCGKVGNGMRFKLWCDAWINGSSFMFKYPRIYLNSEYKDAPLANYGSWELDRWR